jgi:nucleoside-diphosphate-sugar epimerase
VEEALSVRRLLLTGADGYIGVPLAGYLRSRGFEVAGLDAGFFSGDELYPTPEPPPRWGDTRRIQAEDLAGFDAVIHLAELSNDPLGELDPELTRDINYRGTLCLARAAREAGVPRFVYFSSCSVYGAGGEAPCTEETEPRPQSEYARCKVLSENDLRELADSGFAPVLLRNATVYGPSPRMRFDLLANNLAGLAHTRRRIELISDGSPRRPLVHIEDVCRATELALCAPAEAVSAETFNVGDEAGNYSVLAIAEAVRSVYPDCPVVPGPSISDKRSYTVAFRKIRERLGFEPRWHLEQGVAELRALFERVRLTPERFAAPAFTRVRQIRALREAGRVDARLFWLAG